MTIPVERTVRVKPPGPRPLFPGEHMLRMVRSPIDLLMDAAKYGDVVRLGVGPNTYLVNHPDIIHDILVTSQRKFIKSPLLRRMRVMLGDGLLTSEGDLHLRQRRLIQPAFHHQRIDGYARIMTDYAQAAGSRWKDGQALDIHNEMMRLTMVIVGQALFSTDVEGESAEIGQAITTLMHGSSRLRLPLWRLFMRLPLPVNRRLAEASERLDALIYQMISDRRAAVGHGDGLQQNDLLSMLLMARDDQRDGQGMSDRLIRDEALTLFLAGHETTANALTWTWYLLSQHPQVEAKLLEELNQVLAGRAPTAQDAEKLVYTRAVLSESMRLYPPSWTISREALAEYTVGNYLLPAGSIILMSQWVTHHDPRFFPEPHIFDPTRWLGSAAEARPKFSYFPFGGGPRLCIGEPFAWMEGILVLATLTQQWKLRLAPGEKIELLPAVTLRPRHGLVMVLNERNMYYNKYKIQT